MLLLSLAACEPQATASRGVGPRPRGTAGATSSAAADASSLQPPLVEAPLCGSDDFVAHHQPPASSRQWTGSEISTAFKGLSERPGGEGPTGEPPFWDVVRAGLEVVPTLIGLVTDRSPTGVTQWNGTTAAVGDVAILALMKVAPESDYAIYNRFSVPPWREQWDRCGVCTYEEFTKRPGARETLQTDLLAWWSRVKDDLRWRPCRGVMFGGIWATDSEWRALHGR